MIEEKEWNAKKRHNSPHYLSIIPFHTPSPALRRLGKKEPAEESLRNFERKPRNTNSRCQEKKGDWPKSNDQKNAACEKNIGCRQLDSTKRRPLVTFRVSDLEVWEIIG